MARKRDTWRTPLRIIGSLIVGALIGCLVVGAYLVAFQPQTLQLFLLTARHVVSQDAEPSEEQLVQLVYDGLRAQDKRIEFERWQDTSDAHDFAADAIELDDSAHIGPYIKWSQVDEYTCNTSATMGFTGEWFVKYEIDVTYINTADMERAFELELSATADALGLHKKGKKKAKLKKIRDYIVDHVKYSEARGYTSHTAYAALCKGQAVCQGYAALFYRMALEASIPCDIVTGTLDGGDHAWNVVYVGDTWYQIDVTACDTAQDRMSYFMVDKPKLSESHTMSDEDLARYYP